MLTRTHPRFTVPQVRRSRAIKRPVPVAIRLRLRLSDVPNTCTYQVGTGTERKELNSAEPHPLYQVDHANKETRRGRG